MLNVDVDVDVDVEWVQVCPPFAGHDVWICHWMGDRYISAHEVDVDLFLDQINAFYDFK